MVEKRFDDLSRREFLKRSAAGGALFAFGPHIWIPRSMVGFAGDGNPHPNISGLRVVGVQDEKMTGEQKPRSTWLEQEPLVKADLVAANIDRLACALAEEKEVKKAWEKIFVKPPKKAWGDVVVAIKTNHIAKQRTRSAVVAKVAHVLTDVIGVKGTNVHIYDACDGRRMSEETPFKGLPEGVELANRWGGYNIRATVPKPYKDGQQQARCLDHLVKGTVDILIDLALCKGHDQRFGGITLSMKNHFGTFEPNPSHRSGGGADYLIGINKTPEILGQIDPKTGKVLFPRQQLCLIDALWSGRPGTPSGESIGQPNSLYMGVFGPVMDFVLARSLCRDRLGWSVNEEVLGRFLSEFGLKEQDLPNEGKVIDALA